MLALRWHGRDDVRLDDIPLPPSPSRGQLLLDVELTGICGTDVEEWMHGPLNIPVTPHPLTGVSAPITLGHEIVGVVAEAGAGTTIPVGTLVAVEANASCGRCWWCGHEQRQLCRQLATKGLSDDGGLAERMLAPESMCVPVPSHVEAKTAVFCEPLAVAVRAVGRGRVVPGETAVILGGGTIGQLATQVARRAGAQVVVVEPLASRRRLAAERGATIAVHPADADAAVAELTDGRRADLCIESSGATGAVRAGSDLTRGGGRIVVVGVSTAPIALNPVELILREQTITGCLSHVLDDFTAALALLTDGAVRVDDLVSDVVPLRDAVAQGFHALRDEPAAHLKIVVTPHPAAPRARFPLPDGHG